MTNLIQDDADTPPVTSTIVILASDDFRRHVLARTDDTLGELSLLCAVEPVENRSVSCILLHCLSLARGYVAVNETNRPARSLPFSFFLDVLLVASNVKIEILEKTISLLVVVGLVVCPVTIKGEPEIRDFQVARSGDEEVIRFNVAVDPVHPVCFFDAENHLSDVLLRHVLIKDVFSQE